MKKLITALTTTAFCAFMAMAAQAGTGTETNWSASLLFSTQPSGGAAGTEVKDLMPIVVGQGPVATELLKPPSLPGKNITNSDDDARVNAYIVTEDSKKAARSLSLASAATNGKAWAIDVEVEQTGTDLYVEVDPSSFYNGYTFTVVNPDTKELTSFTTAEMATTTKKKVATNVAAKTTIVVVAGTSQTFAVSNGTSVFGTAARKGGAPQSGIGIYVGKIPGEGVTPDAITDSTGVYSLALSSGTYKIRMDKDYYLGTECDSITVSDAGSSTVVCGDIYAGDFNNNGSINALDIAVLAKVYLCAYTQAIATCMVDDTKCNYCNMLKTTYASDPNSSIFYDINNDKVINVLDIAQMKSGYYRSEPWK